MLDPAGPSATLSSWLWWGMFTWFMIVFFAVTGLWLFAMFRTREHLLPRKEARRIQNLWVIGGGIVLPLISIVVILFFGIPAGHKMLPLPPDNGEAVRIDVTARQFEWQVSYPGTDIVLIDELHMPARVPVDIYLTTEDVIHSFWVPRLARKLDTIPGRINVLRLEADEEGVYGGQCSEYCGVEHAHMNFTVTAHSLEAFNRWLEERQDER